eukprot:3314107-Rhodomonas_salina.2
MAILAGALDKASTSVCTKQTEPCPSLVGRRGVEKNHPTPGQGATCSRIVTVIAGFPLGHVTETASESKRKGAPRRRFRIFGTSQHAKRRECGAKLDDRC